MTDYLAPLPEVAVAAWYRRLADRIAKEPVAEERDLLTSLRGFQLKSRVMIAGARSAGSSRVGVEFRQWTCEVHDRYDWDYSEHFTVPNPDFGSTQPGAVHPRDKMMTVYHSNAGRIERAGLAAPFDVASFPWAVSVRSLLARAEVDPTRRL